MTDLGFGGNVDSNKEKRKRKITYFHFPNTPPFLPSSTLYCTSAWGEAQKTKGVRKGEDAEIGRARQCRDFEAV